MHWTDKTDGGAPSTVERGCRERPRRVISRKRTRDRRVGAQRLPVAGSAGRGGRAVLVRARRPSRSDERPGVHRETPPVTRLFHGAGLTCYVPDIPPLVLALLSPTLSAQGCGTQSFVPLATRCALTPGRKQYHHALGKIGAFRAASIGLDKLILKSRLIHLGNYNRSRTAWCGWT